MAVRKRRENNYIASVGTIFSLILLIRIWIQIILAKTELGGETVLYLHIPQIFHSI